MKKPKTLLFLGAGATGPFGYPVTAKFIESFKDKIVDEQEKICLNKLLTGKIKDAEDVINAIKCIEQIGSKPLTVEQSAFSFLWKHLIESGEIFRFRPEGVETKVFRSDIIISMDKKRLSKTLNSLLREIYDEIYVQYQFKSQTLPQLSLHYKSLFEVLKKFSNENVIDLFTTNYDRAIEGWCEKELEIEYVDGFKQEAGKVNWIWSPYDEFKKEPPKGKTLIKFRKLHGSLNWIRSRTTDLPEKTESEDKVSKYNPNFSENVIINLAETDIPKKEEPFKYLFSDFEESISKSDIVLVIGFSLRDDYINKIFLKTLDKRPEFRMIVISLNPKENVSENLLKNDESKIIELIPNQIIPHKMEFGVGNIKDAKQHAQEIENIIMEKVLPFITPIVNFG